MQFTSELEKAAHKFTNGEMSWPRPYVGDAIRAIAAAGYALLGADVLMILEDGGVFGVLPRISGPPGIYGWTVERLTGEEWTEFVLRSEKESLSAIVDYPDESEIDFPEGAMLYYNLVWVSQHEFDKLRQKTGKGESRA